MTSLGIPSSWEEEIAMAEEAKRPSNIGCATGHCLKWGPLPPNGSGKIAQKVRA